MKVTCLSEARCERDYASADRRIRELLATWEPEEEHWQPSDVMELAVALAGAVGLRMDLFAEHLKIAGDAQRRNVY